MITFRIDVTLTDETNERRVTIVSGKLNMEPEFITDTTHEALNAMLLAHLRSHENFITNTMAMDLKMRTEYGVAVDD